MLSDGIVEVLRQPSPPPLAGYYDSAKNKRPRAAKQTDERNNTGLIIFILILIAVIIVILYLCLVKRKKLFNLWCFCVCERCRKG